MPSFSLKDLSQNLLGDIRDWCTGRMWLARVPLIVFMAWLGVRQFIDPMYSMQNLFAGINLGIHEGGHLLFRSFGEFICIAGGSFAQCAAPCLSMLVFLKQRDYFAITFCFGWLSTNLMGVAVYMGDARAMELPLVTVGGGEALHDWYWLFTHMGLLNQCETIAWLTRQCANLSMLLCLISGLWIVWLMYSLDKRPATASSGAKPK